jgi:hypothetical protein
VKHKEEEKKLEDKEISFVNERIKTKTVVLLPKES